MQAVRSAGGLASAEDVRDLRRRDAGPPAVHFGGRGRQDLDHSGDRTEGPATVRHPILRYNAEKTKAATITISEGIVSHESALGGAVSLI